VAADEFSFLCSTVVAELIYIIYFMNIYVVRSTSTVYGSTRNKFMVLILNIQRAQSRLNRLAVFFAGCWKKRHPPSCNST
jgi:hypothetical protein